MIDISYEICAIFITIVLMLNIARTKRTMNLQNIIFQLMIVCNGLTAVFDLAKRIALVASEHPSVGFVDFCTMGYFVAHVFALPFFYIYTLSLIKNWSDISKVHKISSIVPIAIGILLILTNGLTNLIYHIEPDGTYVREKGIAIIYLLAGYYVVHIIIILIRYHKNYSQQKRLTVYSVLGLLLIGIAVQFVFPTLIVETVFNSVSLLVFFFVVQNPHNQLDHSTGMFNRVAFGSTIGNSLNNGKEFSLIVVVIDNITDVSLQEREKVMYMVANYLKSLGRTFVVYRLDQNSLCVAIMDKPAVIVEAIAEEISAQFKKSWQGLSFRVMLKPRICFLSFPCDIKKLDEFRAVFINLKERGFEQGKIYRETDFELKKIVRAAQVSDALIRALEENRFELNYTPIFDSKRMKLFAAEGNLKFRDSELGYVYEDDIQEIAEKSGKMAHLSEWILEQACQTIAQNKLDRTRLRMIFVRLSTSLCLQYGYEDIILEIIHKYNIPPSMICFLVSEYTVSRGAGLLKQGMKKLKENGITFCLENYGSGFTNLSSLYELPFDYMEISRTVIRDALSNEKSKIILESTLTLAKSLHIDTIVAGVNNEEQKLILDKMPCDYVLGVYFLGQLEKKDFLNLINDNPLNSMEGKNLVRMRMEERLLKEKEEAEKQAEFARARKRRVAGAPKPDPNKMNKKGAE